MTDSSSALVPLSAAQRMLAEATETGNIEGMRDVRAVATALQRGAKARGLGITAENEAAVVILRAERAIGQAVGKMREAGMLARRDDFGRGKTSPDSGDVLQISDLGLPHQRVAEWERLAALSDTQFEQMLALATSDPTQRLAKHNFYAKGRALTTSLLHTPATDTRETPIDSTYEKWRTASYALLGWEIDEDGAGAPTRNGLMRLPVDDLRTFAHLVQALAGAYREVVAARG